MRRVTASAFCALLATSLAALAPSPAAAFAPPKTKAEAKDPLERALDAWGRGDWTRVRDVLEPLVRDGGKLETEQQTESALRHLADATLLDESLDAGVRKQLATEYVERLLDQDLEWAPPPDTHGKPLEELTEQLRTARRQKQAENCAIERTTCQANLTELGTAHDQLEAEHETLKLELQQQLVVQRDLATRNRAVALVPAGVGHFYNGHPGLGAGFLAAEVAFGATGLALLLTRTLTYNCVREQGFSRGSVVCTPPRDLVNELGAEGMRKRVENVRNAEQTFGLLFIGTLVLDVLVAQLTFEKYTVVAERKTTRGELEAEERERAPGKPEKRRKRRSKTSAKIRPTFGPGGAGLDIRF